ncbi:MAG: hypothetical protein RL367_2716 [Pseudomonadota bacterium]
MPSDHLAERLARAITLGGPVPVSQFMAAANAHYYATRDPLGVAGDFITAPEISQMFGELIGLWCADLWGQRGRPDCCFVELGPGRGTLAADARRAMRRVGMDPEIHLVETSPVLRAEQARRVPDAVWHDDVTSLPNGKPVFIIANEFFDALPVHQLVCRGASWHERLVACQDILFLPIAGKPVPEAIIPEALRGAAAGSIIESSPASVAIVRALAKLVGANGGAALIIDYGYNGPAIGETLQAVKNHAPANPFEAPGEQDLTAHVDFATLAAMAHLSGTRVLGPVPQGDWLTAIGLDQRCEALRLARPDQAASLEAQRARLIEPQQMGELFQVMALIAPDWPYGEGF